MLKETIKENGKIFKHMIINTIRFSQIKINKCTDMTICKHMCIEVQKQSTLESSISLKWPSGDSHISLLILFFQLQLIVLENLQVNLQMWEIMHVQYKWKSRRVLNFSIDKENKTHDRSLLSFPIYVSCLHFNL